MIKNDHVCHAKCIKWKINSFLDFSKILRQGVYSLACIIFLNVNVQTEFSTRFFKSVVRQSTCIQFLIFVIYVSNLNKLDAPLALVQLHLHDCRIEKIKFYLVS